MKSAFVGLGSNLGDRRGNLAEALRLLAEQPGVSIVRGSSLYETKPVGLTAQPDFLNAVVELSTAHPPPDLLAVCLAIERRLGRERRERWGPRTVDIDLLLVPGLTWQDAHLTLPHPRLHERGFVLIPFNEIAPTATVVGVSIAELVRQVDNSGVRRVAAWAEWASARRESTT
ncbi:MAG TPA: 2-amino-4-hydroxy-6-hydroxymethyldihydropteridine diphosphokinase [Candidatus Didemnitutus sp.]|nr:2-amino-4-hydroxy-6-hydroxymethyldihydropteridine diphosphokinase [Candidatus Didemnitutus sp.]